MPRTVGPDVSVDSDVGEGVEDGEIRLDVVNSVEVVGKDVES